MYYILLKHHQGPVASAVQGNHSQHQSQYHHMHQGPPMNNMAVGVAGIQGSGVQGINHGGTGVQPNMGNPQGHHLHGVLSNEDERKVKSYTCFN